MTANVKCIPFKKGDFYENHVAGPPDIFRGKWL